MMKLETWSIKPLSKAAVQHAIPKDSCCVCICWKKRTHWLSTIALGPGRTLVTLIYVELSEDSICSTDWTRSIKAVMKCRDRNQCLAILNVGFSCFLHTRTITSGRLWVWIYRVHGLVLHLYERLLALHQLQQLLSIRARLAITN